MNVDVKIRVGENHTLSDLRKVLEQRKQYLSESSYNSLIGTALNILKSLRVETVVAKFHKEEINLQVESGLNLGFYTVGNSRRKCLRLGKTRFVKGEREVIKYLDCDYKTARVFSFLVGFKEDKKKKYYIVAGSEKQAMNEAKNIKKKRIEMYKGLARLAIGKLMYKTANQSVVDMANNLTNQTANNNTSVREYISKGEHRLMILDELEYAKSALKNGDTSIDLAYKKAINKTVSIINHRCKNLLGFEKIELPYPEIRQRK